MSKITLSNGLKMPAIGLGTHRIQGSETVFESVAAAWKVGYRLIDTATIYKNETEIGDTLRKLGIPRESIFVTSKLAPKDLGTSKTEKAIEDSLAKLKTDYLDLYLVHWPAAAKLNPKDPKNKVLRAESWQVLESFYDKGTLKSIGVSNYEISHLEELLSSCRIKPHVNQIECHPHLPQKELSKYCSEKGIHLQAYSSLGTTIASNPITDKPDLLHDPVVNEIAKVHKKSPAQVLLKWGLQLGYSVLPKSTNPTHIKENFDLDDFELNSEEMRRLSSLDVNHRYALDPRTVA